MYHIIEILLEQENYQSQVCQGVKWLKVSKTNQKGSICLLNSDPTGLISKPLFVPNDQAGIHVGYEYLQEHKEHSSSWQE